jgi:ribosomal-protein-alanine N-acetyltransferase
MHVCPAGDQNSPASDQNRMAASLAIDVSQISVSQVDVVAALHIASFTEPWDDPWSREFLWRILSTPGAFGFVAQESVSEIDTPVGFALMRMSGEECEILSIGVIPDARRRGVGCALLGSIARLAASRDATSMVLEVAEDNAPAIGLYRSLGLVRVGRRPRYYRRDDKPVDALILRGTITQT